MTFWIFFAFADSKQLTLPTFVAARLLIWSEFIRLSIIIIIITRYFFGLSSNATTRTTIVRVSTSSISQCYNSSGISMVFRWRQKVDRDEAEVTSSGRLFQTLAPAIGKTRLPTVGRRKDRTSSWLDDASQPSSVSTDFVTNECSKQKQ